MEKLVIVDISPVNASSTVMTMPKYFEGMMSVKLDRNVPLSKARRMADEQLAKYVLVCVKNCNMFLSSVKCDTLLSGINLSKFWRNLLFPPSSCCSFATRVSQLKIWHF